MAAIFHPIIYDTIGRYVATFAKQTKYRLTEMKHKHLALWSLIQLQLTYEISGRIWERIDSLPHMSPTDKNELKSILNQLSEMAFPLFVAGMSGNPVHHNFQTVENIIDILSYDDTSNYPLYKKAAILALLHDVGNGVVNPNLKKIKSSDIKDRREELEKQKKNKEEIEEEINALSAQAEEYRDAHMKEGANIARTILAVLNQSKTIVSKDDIEDIVFCIEKHDKPSIAELRQEINRPYDRSHLIPLENDLACLLREADRLWMVSKEGLEKDLFDDLRKGNKPDPCGKLWHNVNRFKEEYKLYTEAAGITEAEKRKFKNESLFRTEGGFKVCKRQVRQRLQDFFETEFFDM
ncbi:hypothetical protein ACFL5Z_11935 [Planctomycetota bacterium]